MADTAMTATAAFGAPDRQAMIEQAAYFRAERRGFMPGQEWEDWFEAEKEVGGSSNGSANLPSPRGRGD